MRDKEKSDQTKDGDGCYVCSCCSYRWKSRKENGLPRNCPSCRSTVWMKSFELRACTRCGYEWSSTNQKPKRCPSCGTYHWNEIPVSYHCLKCNYTWIAKRDWPPKRCPECRSTAWNSKKESSHMGPSQYSLLMQLDISDMDPAEVEGIIERYRKGESCTNIALNSPMPFSIVYEIIRKEYPMSNSIRV
ncbi:MAG: hypothetical protein RBR05_01430 [Candidatus Methanomethylophilaceae archaeon]|nr:hypothetical protein [Candidatus Methanomethylophilaceae archaeon]MDY0224045.1 hypothetical protein [Candidatus Methanomethylophilaceae archaeon]